ncbi:MAG: hypothetical protein ACKOAD_04465 [Gammaproteobacteria bacterium]
MPTNAANKYDLSINTVQMLSVRLGADKKPKNLNLNGPYFKTPKPEETEKLALLEKIEKAVDANFALICPDPNILKYELTDEHARQFKLAITVQIYNACQNNKNLEPSITQDFKAAIKEVYKKGFSVLDPKEHTPSPMDFENIREKQFKESAARIIELKEKKEAGTLSPEEKEELERYREMGKKFFESMPEEEQKAWKKAIKEAFIESYKESSKQEFGEDGKVLSNEEAQSFFEDDIDDLIVGAALTGNFSKNARAAIADAISDEMKEYLKKMLTAPTQSAPASPAEELGDQAFPQPTSEKPDKGAESGIGVGR